MKKIIVTLIITGSLYAQDDIIIKSAGIDATKGILFQNSNADTLMDIDGDGLISISGSLTVKGPFTLSNLLFPTSDGTNGQALTTDGDGVLSWTTISTTDTDDQTLSISGDSLYISEGNSVSLASFKDNTDTQDLSLTADTLSLTDGGSIIIANATSVVANTAKVGVPTAYTLPSADGTNGQTLQTDGSGTLSWTTVSSGGASTITALSDALVEGNSIYLGNDPSASTDNATLNVAVGTTTLDEVTTGDMNTAVGASALSKNTTGSNNTGLGTGALNKSTTGGENTSIGSYSLLENTTGSQNVAVGKSALGANTTSTNNTAVGYNALKNATGKNNTSLGSGAGEGTMTGKDNVFLGKNAWAHDNSGSNQIVIGSGTTGHGDNITVIGNTEMTAWHPADDDGVDLGSSSYEFKDVYVDGTAYIDSIGFGTTKMALPTADGSANQVLQTDGSGTLSWAASGGGASSVNDLSDALVESNSVYVGVNPGSTTDNANYNAALGAYALRVVTTGDGNVATGYLSLSSNTTGSSNDASGYSSLRDNTTGYNNTASGSQSLMGNTVGNNNTGLGSNALRSNDLGGSNTAVGSFALLSNTSGSNNVALGYNAGQTGANNLTTGGSNVLIGASTATSKTNASNQIVIGQGASGHGDNITVIGNTDVTAWHPADDDGVDLGSSSYEFKDMYVDGVTYTDAIGFGTTAITLPTADGSNGQVLTTNGSGTLSWAASGSGASSVNGLTDALVEDNSIYVGNDPSSTTSTAEYNVAVGATALNAVTTADKNTGVGYDALAGVTTGSWNTALGFEAGKAITTGADNTALGLSAGLAITTGSRNIAIGGVALDAADAENDNLAIGYAALGGPINGGEKNVAIGNYSLDALTTGDGNVAVGYEALSNNTTGEYNQAFGQNSLQGNTTGTKNIAIGYKALYASSTENNNLAIGYEALGGSIAGGSENTAIGNASMDELTSGKANTAVGLHSLSSLTTGSNNNVIGYNAGTQVTTGASNTMMGYQAGDVLTTGDENVIIGNNADPSANSGSNQIVIGSGATGHGDNIVVIGNGSNTAIHPHDNNEVDLGSTSYKYKDLHMSGNATIDGSATFKEKITIISSAGNTDLSSDTEGGIIHVQADLSGNTILLPQASANNVGLTYKIFIGYNATDFKIGFSDGGATEYRGAILLSSDVNNNPISDIVINSDNAKVIKVDPDASKIGGAIGSVYELTYIETNQVYIHGNAIVTGSSANSVPEIFDSTGI